MSVASVCSCALGPRKLFLCGEKTGWKIQQKEKVEKNDLLFDILAIYLKVMHLCTWSLMDFFKYWYFYSINNTPGAIKIWFLS